MRWFVGTTSVFMWTALLVGTVSAQRTLPNVNANLRDSINEIDKRPVVLTQGTTPKRLNQNPAVDQSRTDGTLPSRDQINNGTVTVITAPVGGALAAMGSDLAQVLDDGERLRVLTVLGKGPEQNLIDILRLRSIDMGFVGSDTFDLVKMKYNIPSLEERVHYIAKIYNSDIHIVARKEIKTIYDLQGKKIYSPVGYPSVLNIITRLGIKPAIIDDNPDDTGVLHKTLNGEADAWIVAAGKVAPIIKNIKNDDGRFHLVPIPWDKGVQGVYLPSSITSAEYPNLVAPGETVDTLAFSLLLMVYNWPPGTDRYNRVAKFVDAMFSKINLLQQPIRHPKWKETAIAATIPGLHRFKAAEDWLTQANLAQAAETRSLREADKTQLYNEFMEWRRRFNR